MEGYLYIYDRQAYHASIDKGILKLGVAGNKLFPKKTCILQISIDCNMNREIARQVREMDGF